MIKIFFRADAGTNIGYGHFIRTLALASMLKDDFDCYFATVAPTEHQLKEIDKVCQYIYLPTDETHFDYFLSLLVGDEIVVLDNYFFSRDYQQQIKTKGCKLVCIDDLHDKEFIADLIINHAPGIVPKDYTAQPYTQFALGLEYALLRPTFLEQAKKDRKIEKIETLLICFGGSDLKDLTQRTLKVAINFLELSKIIVVTGPGYQLTDDFIRLIESDKRIDHRHNLNEKQMLVAMLESELAIVPSSGIMLESIAVGCVVMSGMYIENQRYIYENFVKSGSIIDCGEFEFDQISNSLFDILTNRKWKQTKAIDGGSYSRINKVFKQIQNTFYITIRRALCTDLNITYLWANKPEIRQFSFNQNHISNLEHSTWFLNKLKDPNCYYYIFEYMGNPIGSIRFDISNNEALISYLLDPLYHGKGLGILLLKNGIQSLMQETTSICTSFEQISGYVMKTNISSIKAFYKLGFNGIEEKETIKFRKRV